MDDMVFNFNFSEFESIFLLLNYIALGGYSLYRYFNPEKWFEKSAVSIFLVYLLTLFILITPAFVLNEPSFFVLFIFLVLGICIIYIVKDEVKQYGVEWILPLGLYLFSVVQEMFQALNSKEANAYMGLVGWYLMGFILIPLLAGVAGKIFEKLFLAIAKEHMKIMNVNVATSPSAFALWGIVYSIWMLIRILHAII